jgi:hypothetical protein
MLLSQAEMSERVGNYATYRRQGTIEERTPEQNSHEMVNMYNTPKPNLQKTHRAGATAKHTEKRVLFRDVPCSSTRRFCRPIVLFNASFNAPSLSTRAAPMVAEMLWKEALCHAM